MAYALPRPAQGGTKERFIAFLARVRTAAAQRQKYNQTCRELNALSSRDLADLGIHPAMIPEIAREAARGE